MNRFVQVDDPAGGVAVNVVKMTPETHATWPDKDRLIEDAAAQKGWLWDGSSFTAPTPPAAPDLYPTRQEAIDAIIAWGNRVTKLITGPVLDDEKPSWPIKELAATAYLADSATTEQQALIDNEVALRVAGGETIDGDGLANKILTKAAAYRTAVSALTAMRSTTVTALEAVSTPAEYEAVVAASLANAQAWAQSELGLDLTDV